MRRRQDGPGLFDPPPSTTPPKTVWELHREEREQAARACGVPLTVPENERRKIIGMAHALDGAALDWRERADRWVETLPPGATFTSEDLTDAVGLPVGQVGTNKNNAVGAVISAYARTGLIHDSGTWIKSSRASSHAAKVSVWMRTSKSH